ncbi:hypothetical protein HMPREF1152_0712 [Mogibacterium sp. CM50]|uniref:Uncharacterized protein n=1 Tax=Mogibacterium timidum ATCC 33093 TaxID=1401079 RepID=X8J6T6_9FIRM|nr:hypothetical protein HMPREF1152_0712 [Mogibacterium sp. CM50]EUC58008.1 hypothetical protein HMPREF0581_1281 [Mogibacterium timidum ATCC 33093]
MFTKGSCMKALPIEARCICKTKLRYNENRPEPIGSGLFSLMCV